ncbi:MAG TPA: response regulator, partial [Chloroflexota bacterium]|nr:response regulator [Chloroflexota bacterium]
MSTPLRLLLVEDSARDAALLVRLLRQGQFEVVFERVETVAGMETALEQGWDLIIADHSMPSFGAEAALEMLQLRNLDLPLIMVSGTISDEAAIEAMKRGAADYLLKDRLNRLGEAVHRVLAEKRLRAEKEEAEARIRFQARLLEAVEQAVIATNLDGIIIYWNTFAERL